MRILKKIGLNVFYVLVVLIMWVTFPLWVIYLIFVFRNEDDDMEAADRHRLRNLGEPVKL